MQYQLSSVFISLFLQYDKFINKYHIIKQRPSWFELLVQLSVLMLNGQDLHYVHVLYEENVCVGGVNQAYSRLSTTHGHYCGQHPHRLRAGRL